MALDVKPPTTTSSSNSVVLLYTLPAAHRKTCLFVGHDVDMIQEPWSATDILMHSEMITIPCQWDETQILLMVSLKERGLVV
jgi:hypothetical protein